MTLLWILALITASTACLYKNEKYKDGDTWVVRSTFVMQCKIKAGGWTTKVIGCRTSSGNVVEPGKQIKEGDTTYECLALGGGRVEIRRTYNVPPSKSCEGHAVGEAWITQKNFVKECTEDGARIQQCLTDAGIPVKLDTNLLLSGVNYSCVLNKNGTVSINREAIPQKTNLQIDNLRPVEVLGPMFKQFKTLSKILSPEERAPARDASPNSQVTCLSKGKTYNVNETWITDHRFTKRCTPDGSVVIVNCILDDNTLLDVNKELQVGSKTFKCYRNVKEGRVYLEVLLA